MMNSPFHMSRTPRELDKPRKSNMKNLHSSARALHPFLKIVKQSLKAKISTLSSESNSSIRFYGRQTTRYSLTSKRHQVERKLRYKMHADDKIPHQKTQSISRAAGRYFIARGFLIQRSEESCTKMTSQLIEKLGKYHSKETDAF